MLPTFSLLYSTILRGKWLIDFREIEAHQAFIDKLLTRNLSSDDSQPDRAPLNILLATGTEMSSASNFKDAPAGSVAIIPLQGTMLKYGTWCSYGTTEIAATINEAIASQKIIGIVLDIDSGGGSVDAIAPLLESIKKAQSKNKPVVASCDLCASAAYYIACHCNEIMASNDISSEFGSIGVMMSFMDYAKYYEKEGFTQHTIYSNLSTHKNAPFEAAKKGDYATIKTEQLDPLAAKFQEAVKHQRNNKLNTTVEGILAGRVFYASDAKKNGLIDSIGTLQTAVQRVKEIRLDASINQYIHSKS
ncbi:putative signal peptide peptidase SppA [termite gut metagenome]|uniref:Putative signal peptide peptidase SppA n=1 Tax=termite gut metagenome TaxID=433724 RepID=A0A5J4SS46_9ZZZZ